MSDRPNHEKGTIAFAFGLAGLIFLPCGWILGPIGLYMSTTYAKECKVAGVEPTQLGTIGKVLSLVSTVVGCVFVLFQLAMMIFGVGFSVLLALVGSVLAFLGSVFAMAEL